MDPYAFEHFVAAIWEHYGFQCEVSRASNDDGIDVRAVNPDADPPQKHLIQAKRYGPESWVRGPEVQQYSALYRHEPGVTEVHVVTSNDFTKAAYKHAERYGVHLSTGENIVNTVQQIKDETGKALLETLADPAPPPIQLGWAKTAGVFLLGGSGVWAILSALVALLWAWTAAAGPAAIAGAVILLVIGIVAFVKAKDTMEAPPERDFGY